MENIPQCGNTDAEILNARCLIGLPSITERLLLLLLPFLPFIWPVVPSSISSVFLFLVSFGSSDSATALSTYMEEQMVYLVKKKTVMQPHIQHDCTCSSSSTAVTSAMFRLVPVAFPRRVFTCASWLETSAPVAGSATSWEPSSVAAFSFSFSCVTFEAQQCVRDVHKRVRGCG